MARAVLAAAVLALTAAACASPGPRVDARLAAQVEVIVRARPFAERGSDKYRIQSLHVVKVLKNTSGAAIGDSVDVTTYRWKDGIPEGESIVYLQRYPTLHSLWMAYDGMRAAGSAP